MLLARYVLRIVLMDKLHKTLYHILIGMYENDKFCKSIKCSLKKESKLY